MRQSVAKLAETARALRLTRTSGPHGVRIGTPPAELPGRLRALLDALEAFDAESANGAAPDPDPQMLSAGIDGIFRWIAAQGLSTDEPLAILAKALGKAPKRTSKLVPMPRFATGFEKKKAWKPKLSLDRDMDSAMVGLGTDATNALAFRMEETARLMGQGVVVPVEAPEPVEASLTMGPC